jgi:hypothetical protein
MARIAPGNTRTGAIAFPAAAARSPLEASRNLVHHRAKEAPAMSARETRITRQAQHQGREEAASRGQLLVYLGYAPGSARRAPCWARVTGARRMVPTWWWRAPRRTVGRIRPSCWQATRSFPRPGCRTWARWRGRWTSARSWPAGPRSLWWTTGPRPLAVEPGITITAPRTTSRDIKRRKASNYQPG